MLKREHLYKEISGIDFNEERLIISFIDNTGIVVRDSMQQCCEERYMTTDDNLSDFIGSNLLYVGVRDVIKQSEKGGGWDDIQFLLVTTTIGIFTIESHNEHNGYYAGFNITIGELQ